MAPAQGEEAPPPVVVVVVVGDVVGGWKSDDSPFDREGGLNLEEERNGWSLSWWLFLAGTTPRTAWEKAGEEGR